tara:strand:- start:202 stop:363 length:162 start_codon:yes stop_codon:yes gene_type:complete
MKPDHLVGKFIPFTVAAGVGSVGVDSLDDDDVEAVVEEEGVDCFPTYSKGERL